MLMASQKPHRSAISRPAGARDISIAVVAGQTGKHSLILSFPFLDPSATLAGDTIVIVLYAAASFRALAKAGATSAMKRAISSLTC